MRGLLGALAGRRGGVALLETLLRSRLCLPPLRASRLGEDDRWPTPPLWGDLASDLRVLLGGLPADWRRSFGAGDCVVLVLPSPGRAAFPSTLRSSLLPLAVFASSPELLSLLLLLLLPECDDSLEEPDELPSDEEADLRAFFGGGLAGRRFSSFFAFLGGGGDALGDLGFFLLRLGEGDADGLCALSRRPALRSFLSEERRLSSHLVSSPRPRPFATGLAERRRRPSSLFLGRRSSRLGGLALALRFRPLLLGRRSSRAGGLALALRLRLLFRCGLASRPLSSEPLLPRDGDFSSEAALPRCWLSRPSRPSVRGGARLGEESADALRARCRRLSPLLPCFTGDSSSALPRCRLSRPSFRGGARLGERSSDELGARSRLSSLLPRFTGDSSSELCLPVRRSLLSLSFRAGDLPSRSRRCGFSERLGEAESRRRCIEVLFRCSGVSSRFFLGSSSRPRLSFGLSRGAGLTDLLKE